MNTNVELAAASVIGREHRRVDRPCQDAFAIRRAGDAVVAVVCDGCGAGAHSELGARLGANLLATAMLELGAWRAACDRVLATLAGLAPALGERAVERHLLFTIVAAAITPAGASILVVGDGVVIVDGAARVIASADNAPLYLGYELCGAAVPLDVAELAAWSSIVLASDGAAPLVDELAAAPADDRLFTNPDALRRRLVVAGRDRVVLDDDATAVIVRRRAP